MSSSMLKNTAENADEKTQNIETQNRETQNIETQNIETQNREAQNIETQNRETQNIETQNRETQNIETQNRETQNIETQNREIPSDIILTNILPRLPASSLHRFKWVCKEWRLLISSSEFINKHTSHPNYLSSRSVLSISPNSSLTGFDYGDSQNVQIINFGRYSTTNPIFLIGSCNGLVLLICSHALNFGQFLNCGFDYRVYNPVLKLDIVIPQPRGFVLRSDHFAAKDYSFGFGYSSTLKTYYIVAINFRMGNLLVFKSSTRKWAIKQILPSDLAILFEDAWYKHGGTLVNEALHWGVSYTMLGNTIKRIAAFNLVSQPEIRYMKLPCANFGEYDILRSAFSLCCINDRLCAWAYYYRGNVVDMWMMKEYGVRESWTRLFCGDMKYVYDFFELTKAREVMMFRFNWLLLIDLSQVPLEGRFVHFGNQMAAVSYVQSLVSPRAVFLFGEQNGRMDDIHWEN